MSVSCSPGGLYTESRIKTASDQRHFSLLWRPLLALAKGGPLELPSTVQSGRTDLVWQTWSDGFPLPTNDPIASQDKLVGNRNLGGAVYVMALSSEELLLLGTAAVILTDTKKRKHKKWSKDWLLKRQKFSHISLLEELRLESDDWFNYLRMDHDIRFLTVSMVASLSFSFNFSANSSYASFFFSLFK